MLPLISQQLWEMPLKTSRRDAESLQTETKPNHKRSIAHTCKALHLPSYPSLSLLETQSLLLMKQVLLATLHR